MSTPHLRGAPRLWLLATAGNNAQKPVATRPQVFLGDVVIEPLPVPRTEPQLLRLDNTRIDLAGETEQ